MVTESTNGLHLPDLLIENYRVIDRLEIGRLGRVTLLCGRNDVGKSTVLEAVRVFAARGLPHVLAGVLSQHEEFEYGNFEYPPLQGPSSFTERHQPLAYSSLFHGRYATPERPIRVGPNSDEGEVRIEVVPEIEGAPKQGSQTAISKVENLQAFKLVYGDQDQLLPQPLFPGQFGGLSYGRGQQPFKTEDWPAVPCRFLGSHGSSIPRLKMLSRPHFLRAGEGRLALQALRFLRNDVEGIVTVTFRRPNCSQDLNAFGPLSVKLRDEPHFVPLRSLGHGAMRLFDIGLAIANIRDGFLLIDQVESDMHHSVHRKLWRMILRAASRNNLQVLATTQSMDCVRGFARALSEVDEVEGVLLRLDRRKAGLRAVEYTQQKLVTAAEQGIEVR